MRQRSSHAAWLAVVAVGLALAAAPGLGQQPLDITASVGWSEEEGNNHPIVTFRSNVPRTATSATLEYGPADGSQPLQTTAAFLHINPTISQAYAIVELRYDVVYRARLAIQTPDGPLSSRELRLKPEPRLMRSKPYLQYGTVRRSQRMRASALENVMIVAARGWRAYRCRSTENLSIRNCTLVQRRIGTNQPVLLTKRHDIGHRQLRVIIVKADDQSARRMRLTVRRFGRGTMPGCSQMTLLYTNDCPSILFAGGLDGRVHSVLVDAGVRSAGARVGLTCSGPGCPKRYQERRPHRDGSPLRFTGYRDLRPGATLRVSIRARGYDGSSRRLQITRRGPKAYGFECLRTGSMTAVIPCR